VCSLDAETGLCVGCLRTLDEIAGWIDMSNEDRRALLSQLEMRRRTAASAAAFDARGSGNGER